MLLQCNAVKTELRDAHQQIYDLTNQQQELQRQCEAEAGARRQQQAASLALMEQHLTLQHQHEQLSCQVYRPGWMCVCLRIYHLCVC